MGRLCEVCQEQSAKYCCPACQVRSCSLACVQAHKKESKCPGLKVAPSAPTSATKYDEEAFVQDYQFLEKVNTFAETQQATVQANKRDKRALLARKVQQVAKLAEFHFLPETFSRAKLNRSRISRITITKSSAASVDGAQLQESEPLPESTRVQQMVWTVDLVPKGRPSDVKTVHGIADSEALSAVLGDLAAARIFLKLESRKERIEEPLFEVPPGRWADSLYSILQGTRFIEYPTFVYE